jgi:hypothetical protein
LRIQPNSSGIPRFNTPLELGLALYRSRTTTDEHRVHIFEQENYRIQQSTSDLNDIDPSIHDGTPKGVMAACGMSSCARTKRAPCLR